MGRDAKLDGNGSMAAMAALCAALCAGCVPVGGHAEPGPDTAAGGDGSPGYEDASDRGAPDDGSSGDAGIPPSDAAGGSPRDGAPMDRGALDADTSEDSGANGGPDVADGGPCPPDQCPCPANAFVCGDGACVDPALVCDRVEHCGDGSDELGCCAGDGECPLRWRCVETRCVPGCLFDDRCPVEERCRGEVCAGLRGRR